MSVEGREVELAPCPFCGTANPCSMDMEPETHKSHWEIWCDGDWCDATVSSDGSGSFESAAKAWNRRATPPDQPLRAALGKLADELADQAGRQREGGLCVLAALCDQHAAKLRTLLAQAINASSLAKELQAKPAAGTPTTKGE